MTHEDGVRWMSGNVEVDSAVWWLTERDSVRAGCALHWSSGRLRDLAARDSERSDSASSPNDEERFGH